MGVRHWPTALTRTQGFVGLQGLPRQCLRWLTSQGGRWLRISALILPLAAVLGCRPTPSAPPRKIVLQQSWELEPGEVIEGYLVAASLGDISVYLKGDTLRAPFAGNVERAAAGVNCVYFSTPEVPAYLFRFCGLRRPYVGAVEAGQAIGAAEYVHFATMRQQPDGTWAIVEPSSHVLERALQPQFQTARP